jgi:predicted nucleotidyltransferase
VKLAIRSAHSALLASIREAPGSPRVVVIGATAVLHHLSPYRETGDIDLAIVAEEGEVKAILAAAAWVRDDHAKQRWRHEASDSIVDILPATSRILRDGRLRFEGDDMDLSMVGFDLALSNTVTVSLDDARHNVEVATLPALAMLKMVAWLDRPYDRTKDLGDIARILDGSLDDSDERRWEEPLYAIDHEDQSAFFAGRELASIVRDHHRSKIGEFFERMATEAWLAVMARQGRWIGADPEAIARRRLGAFREGLG